MAAEKQRGRSDDTMDRKTLRVPPVLLEAAEEYAEDMGYANSAEAHRQALREFIPDEYFPIRERHPTQTNGGSD